MISLFHPQLNIPKIQENINKVLNEKIIADGTWVEEFEQKLGEYLSDIYSGTRYRIVALNSGTAALHIAYILAGVKPGDEVIVPVLTCTATTHPILWLGAKPVFADIQSDTLNIDPKDIKKKITDKTKAIVVMHNGGLPCDMDEIMAIADEYHLKVIEDAAQAFGGEYKGQKLGTIGDYNCFSLQAIKSLTTGDGGFIVCKDEKDESIARQLKWFGIDRIQQKKRGSLVPSKFAKLFEQRAMTFDIDITGYKYNMNNITAAIGLANLEKINDWLEQRKEFARIYRNELAGLKNLKLLKETEGNSNWLFQIIIPEGREKFQREMGKAGIETNMVQVNNQLYNIFRPYATSCPIMDGLQENYVSIPLHCNLNKEDIYLVCDAIKKIC